MESSGQLPEPAPTGYEGDDGPALQASFRSISSIKPDLQGNVYVSDSLSQVVRRIDRAGTIVTVAGSGLSRPSSLAIDAGGNVFIADPTDNLVYQLSPDGRLSHFAGTGKPGSDFNLSGSEQATQVSFTPVQIASDSKGGLLILDARSVVLRVDANNTISRIVGGGLTPPRDGIMATEARFSISGVDVSPLDEVYVVQSALAPLAPGSTIWMKVDENGRLLSAPGSVQSSPKLVGFTPDGQPIGASVQGVLSRLSQDQLIPIAGVSSAGFGGDGGPGAEAKLDLPGDLATDSEGSLFVVDAGNRRVRKLSPAGIISTYYYPESAVESPLSVTADREGNVYVASSLDRIRRIDRFGAVSLVLGGGFPASRFDPIPAVQAYVLNVNALKADPDGNLFFTSTGFPGYWMIAVDSGLLMPRNQGKSPYYVVGRDNDGGILAIADRLYRLTAASPPIVPPAPPGQTFFRGAYATDPVSKSIFYIGNNNFDLMRLDRDGTLHIVVSVVDADNIFSAASPAVLPRKIEFDEHGDLFVADQQNRVRKLTNAAACPVTPVL